MIAIINIDKNVRQKGYHLYSLSVRFKDMKAGNVRFSTLDWQDVGKYHYSIKLTHLLGHGIDVVCDECGGSGDYKTGVEDSGIEEIVGCPSCNGIGKATLKITDIQVSNNTVTYTLDVPNG